MTKPTKLHPRPTRHPDDPYVDETRIRIEDRYKTSSLSGDEWRFRYLIELVRKGTVVAYRHAGSMQFAVIEQARAVHLGLGELDESWTVLPWKDHPNGGICCQPGCPNEATSTYVMKKKYDASCSFDCPNEGILGEIAAREFCDEHRQRGESGLDDGNGNYVCVKGKDWNDAPVDPAKVSEALLVTDVH